ncbi:MAG: hypothetical protein IIB77_12725, partial [Proteobacteria bacterium]|nr:hypothetical protein [Pseudomonadota bacterium]
MAPVGRVQELAVRRDLDLGAGVLAIVPLGQRGHGLDGVQTALVRVEAVDGYAVALLIGGIDDVLARMETDMAGALRLPGVGPGRRQGRETSRFGVEPELEDRIGARHGALRDVGDVGEPVGGVGLDVVGPDLGLPPDHGRVGQRAVF